MPKNHDGRDLCHFTYADGRRCTLPQFPDDLGLCYHHGQLRRTRLESKQAGREISKFLTTDALTACDLTAALSTAFAFTAQGYTKPKTAMALGYLARILFQVQQAAKQEFLETFEDKWPKVVEEGPVFNLPEPEPPPALQPTVPPQTPSSALQAQSDPISISDSPAVDPRRASDANSDASDPHFPLDGEKVVILDAAKDASKHL